MPAAPSGQAPPALSRNSAGGNLSANAHETPPSLSGGGFIVSGMDKPTFPLTDPEVISDAINSEIAGALSVERMSDDDDITCYSEWFATNTAGEVYPAVENAAGLRALTLEWLEACIDGDYLSPAGIEIVRQAQRELKPIRYAQVEAAFTPSLLSAPDQAIAWHYATATEPAGWVYDEAALDEYRAADPSLIVPITEEAKP